MESHEQRKKVVLVGDKGVGKTSLINAWIVGKFSDCVESTVFDNKDASISTKDGHQLKLSLSDTSGDEAYDRLRPLSYLDSDLVLLCFAMNSNESLRNVSERWIPEIKHILPAVPIILLGTKSDLKKDLLSVNGDPVKRNEEHVDDNIHTNVPTSVRSEEGKVLSWSIGAFSFIECSSKSQQGLQLLQECIANCLVNRDSTQVKWKKMSKLVAI